MLREGKVTETGTVRTLAYLRQNDGHSRPGDLNVLGNTLKIRL